jgi:hypothetical protein
MEAAMQPAIAPIPGHDSPEQQLELAFQPLHKRAFGMAAGLALGTTVLLVTLVHLYRAADPYPLVLLSAYFYGYEVTWKGAAVGFFWGSVAGFTAGWFFAFCRNLAVATITFILRTRAELERLRDFLDHI